MALGQLLFGSGDRHLTAEMLHMEAIGSSIPVSLATVYNTLHQFTEAGLLREVAVEGSKTYFDTNTSDHHHFYFERDGALMDVQDGSITVHALPEPPEGMEISRVDVLIRLVAKGEREREEG
jgi:Fur family transcriptional regulator, iron response regulator